MHGKNSMAKRHEEAQGEGLGWILLEHSTSCEWLSYQK